MKTTLIDYQTKQSIGNINLNAQPRTGECVQIEAKLYYIHRIIHTESSLKLVVMKKDEDS